MSDEQLKELYYNPETGLRSRAHLYAAAKAAGHKVTHKSIKEFLDKQSTSQIHAKPVATKAFFPIKAKEKDAIWNLDLTDVSNSDSKNDGVTFLFLVCDIYTRYCFCYPMKNKKTATIINTFTQLLTDCEKVGHTKPKVILSDNGSEFTSKEWIELVAANGIQQSYAKVGDHFRNGVIDRLTQTIRSMIEKYCTAAKTERYIGQLPKIIKNYNNSYHKSIGTTPAAGGNDEFIARRIKLKETAAKLGLKQFKLGDSVRYILIKGLFEKGSKANWSKSVHKITGITENKRVYTLDNNKTYKYYQLFKIPGSESHEYPKEEEKKEQSEKPIRPKSQRRALNKEGVEPDKNITEEKKRERIPRLFYNKATGKYETN